MEFKLEGASRSRLCQPGMTTSKGPFIIYAGGWAGKNKRGRGVGGSRQFHDSPRGGGREEIGVQEGGGLSDFTILFYLKEMCSLLSPVLNGT